MFPKSKLDFPGCKEYFFCLTSLQHIIHLIESGYFNPRSASVAKLYLNRLEEKQALLIDLDAELLITQLRNAVHYYEQSHTVKDLSKIKLWREVYERVNSEYEKVIFSG